MSGKGEINPRLAEVKAQTARLDRLLKGTATPANYERRGAPKYGNVGIIGPYTNVGVLQGIRKAATGVAAAATEVAASATAALKRAATRKASPPHKGGYRKAGRARKTRRYQ